MQTPSKKESRNKMPSINSKRLRTIADMVDYGARIADVGSDHCYVPIMCCKENKIEYAQAIDNKKAPYEKIIKTIKENGLESKIKPSLSDGLDQLDEETDTLILAGMGGKLIISILDKNINKLEHINTIIIDAHNDRYEIIKYLEKIGYKIIQNCFLYEAGIAYDIMKWKKGKAEKEYTEEELKYGPLNLLAKGEDWKRYWLSEKNRIEKILQLEQLPDSKKNEYQKEFESINKIL